MDFLQKQQKTIWKTSFTLQQSVKGCDYCNNSHFFENQRLFGTSVPFIYYIVVCVQQQTDGNPIQYYTLRIRCSFPDCKGELCGLIICFAAVLLSGSLFSSSKCCMAEVNQLRQAGRPLTCNQRCCQQIIQLMTLRPLQTSQSTFSPSFTLVYLQFQGILMHDQKRSIFKSHNDFKECVWVEVPLLSWFDHGETVEMTLQYGKAAEMEKRDLWPGLIRRCSWKCHSCTAKDSLIIIKTHMVTVLHSVLSDSFSLN